MGAFSLAAHNLMHFAFVHNTNLCVLHPSNEAAAVSKHMQGFVTNGEGFKGYRQVDNFLTNEHGKHLQRT